jgi:hypothetical protein
MKSLFAGYYRPTDKEFDELWKNCMFVFDASVLLDLYRSTAKTRDVLISILEKIKDRIWLPYQSGWEYQENRLDVIAKERELYSELRETLSGLVKSVQQKMHNHSVESAEKIKEELGSSIKKIIEIVDQGAKEHPNLIAKDHIQERITELFAGKVGKKLDEKRLATIYREGTERYEQKIPPGYKDSDKGGTRQFGDLVIWNELLEHARATKLPIIFITSDTKEDWWWKQGQQTIGPRPELVQEVASFASAKFYMYSVERFLSEAQKRFDTKVEATAVKEAAEEFKDIQQKKAEETFPNVSTILRDWQVAALGIKRVSSQPEGRLPMQWLETIPASEAGKVVNTVWVHAVEDLLGRSCTKKEADMIRRVVRSEPFFRIASTAKNLWEIAEKLALLFDYEGKIEKLKMP